jgi:hypothetical protein
MIQMDIPAAYVCSQIFAYCGRDWLVHETPSWSGRYTALAVTYALGIIGACGLYLYSGWTEWEMMYWFEDVRMETANFGNPLLALVGPLFLAALGAASLIGFKLAHRWIVERKPKKVLISLCLGAAVSLIMVLFTPSAPMLVGHYHNYHGFVNEAIASAKPWDYGLVVLGAWKLCIPWAVNGELLVKHELVTFFNPRFFVPWLIDILIFFGSAFAVAGWYRRHKPVH